jgi:hypothetical protein
MTAILTNEERIAALQKFGYDVQEAEFLCVATLHSGYFLRRQFLAFMQRSRGWRDSALIEKLKANRHCRTTMYRENRMVYHLAAKPLYDALGERDNRNRRERQPSTIKNKIMGLDFVLDHPQHEYLSTEREKLDYFLGNLKIAPDVCRRAGISLRVGAGRPPNILWTSFRCFFRSRKAGLPLWFISAM